MKVFAILTAALMTAGGATYYISSEGCPFSGCPTAKSGGCCVTDKVSDCAAACSLCSDECLDCCTVCEECCVAGASIATASKTDCCAVAAACCDKASACCADKGGPTEIATAAVLAGASVK